MAIKQIKISNFKSFDELDLELGKFNVIIGANASGKSNFVQIFKFLKSIAKDGLDDAVSLQGGVEYLRNTIIRSSSDFSLSVVSDEKITLPLTYKEKTLIGLQTKQLSYEFAISFAKRGSGFEICRDELILDCQFVRLVTKQKRGPTKVQKLKDGKILVSHRDGNVTIKLESPHRLPIRREDILPPFFPEERLASKTLLLDRSFMAFPVLWALQGVFAALSIYDFDPKLPKKAVPITGKAELEEDGSNLAIVLKNIIKRKDEKRKLFNLIKDLLPYVRDFRVEKFADKSVLPTYRETYAPKLYLPASSISDGTINITALIIPLYFEKRPLVIIEEPERNIHPFLIRKVVNMMKEASEKKQIIVTTHNPEVVKYAGLENLLLISRDKEGFSNISRPADKKQVRAFLENEIGPDELFVQDLLGV